jgi:hypothetical protein
MFRKREMKVLSFHRCIFSSTRLQEDHRGKETGIPGAAKHGPPGKNRMLQDFRALQPSHPLRSIFGNGSAPFPKIHFITAFFLSNSHMPKPPKNLLRLIELCR